MQFIPAIIVMAVVASLSITVIILYYKGKK